MLFLNALLTDEREALENMKRYIPATSHGCVAQAVLLSPAGFTLKELSAIFWDVQVNNGNLIKDMGKSRYRRPPG
jgi:hypothetical protein